MAHQNNV